MAAINSSAFSQSSDTCNYVSQHNDIGGLDCYLGTLAPYVADSYQWLNCDSLNAPLPNDTTGAFSASYYGYVALEVTYLGCVDTSMCVLQCHWGLDEGQENGDFSIHPNPSTDYNYY